MLISCLEFITVVDDSRLQKQKQRSRPEFSLSFSPVASCLSRASLFPYRCQLVRTADAGVRPVSGSMFNVQLRGVSLLLAVEPERLYQLNVRRLHYQCILVPKICF